VYRTHTPSITLFPDAVRCLAALRDAGLVLGLVTDGDPEVQRAKVAALGLRGVFEVERYSWDAGAALQKPHASAFEPALAALAALRIRARDLAYVGDNPTKDFVGARALGLTTLRLRRGPHAAVRVSRALDADHSITSLDELSAWALDRAKGSARRETG
jgi:putative hydrolase of the HAD superfamily